MLNYETLYQSVRAQNPSDYNLMIPENRFKKFVKSLRAPMADSSQKILPVSFTLSNDYPIHRNFVTEGYSITEIPVSLYPANFFFSPQVDLLNSTCIGTDGEGNSYTADFDLNRLFILENKRNSSSSSSGSISVWPYYFCRIIKHTPNGRECFQQLVTFDLKNVFEDLKNLLPLSDFTMLYQAMEKVHPLNLMDFHAKNHREYALDALKHIFGEIIKFPEQNRSFLLNATIYNLSLYQPEIRMYPDILQMILSYFPWDMAKTASSFDLMLQMQFSMYHLNQIKPTLPVIQSCYNPPAFFTDDQRSIIQSSDPLILVQSGAGTGKTTTISSRVESLIQSGVDPHDILAISYTNAAANALHAKAPNITSITSSKLIAMLYEDDENFGKQSSSNLKTICNTIRIMLDENQNPEIPKPLAEKLIEYLQDVDKHPRSNASKARLTAFMDKHLTTVISILNAINQTSLELQELLCTIRLNQITIPEELQTRFLIVDEVQDFSTSDFIFFLNFAIRQSMNTIFIGDGSQTLYEFRSANAEAMTMLENSGIFKIYKLQTNHRSTQPVLDFANLDLDLLTSNISANLQLHNAQTAPYSYPASAINVGYKSVERKISMVDDELDQWIKELIPWIEEKMKRKETIAFLAHKKSHVEMMQTIVSSLFPQAKTINLSPNEETAASMFTEYLKHPSYLNDLMNECYKPNLIQAIISDIKHNELLKIENSICFDKEARIEKMNRDLDSLFSQWCKEKRASMENWNRTLQTSTPENNRQVLTEIRKSLIDTEIRYNNRNSEIVKEKSSKTRNSSLDVYDFVFSTIHSSKGMEFPHTAILYTQSILTQNVTDEDKRMYYVALTRAKKDERILAVHTKPNCLMDCIFDEYQQRFNTRHAPVQTQTYQQAASC